MVLGHPALDFLLAINIQNFAYKEGCDNSQQSRGRQEKRETPAEFLMEELDKDLTRFELKKRRMKVKREIRDIRKRARERIVKVKEKAGYISDSEEEDQLEDNGIIDIKTETPKVKKEPDTRNVEVETGNNREFEENIRKN